MPHQCVKCSKIYTDVSDELLKGCECGGRFFFFIKKEDLEEASRITGSLSSDEKEQIEADVSELIGLEDSDKPVILDLESIRVTKPGKYEISLVDLFSGKPLVFRIGEGKYVIDLASSFKKDK